MPTYKFATWWEYTSDDPESPVSGPCCVELTFVAADLTGAKAQFASALRAAGSNEDVARISQITTVRNGVPTRDQRVAAVESAPVVRGG